MGLRQGGDHRLWLPVGCGDERPGRGCAVVPQAGGRDAEWRWGAVGSFVMPEREEERTEGRLGLGLEVSSCFQRKAHGRLSHLPEG